MSFEPKTLLNWLGAGILALLAGCATPGHSPEPVQTAMTTASMGQPPSPAPGLLAEKPSAVAPTKESQNPKTPDGPAQVLAWADRVRSLSTPDLSLEISRIAEPPDAPRSPTAELQLAIGLGQTHLPSDLPRALASLQKVLADPGDEARALHPLARLVAARLAEQKRVEDQLEKQNQQLRDQQRRLDQLNERLEAMRAIERSMVPKK